MGSDLQLTGLASGFDWKPVVEQLVELEAIPKKRLQSEKSSNEGKISDLGLLKSQLDTLNGASKALSNEDLYDARKITLDSDSAAVLSASAALCPWQRSSAHNSIPRPAPEAMAAPQGEMKYILILYVQYVIIYYNPY